MTEATKQIKIMLPPDNHDQVRVAAALRRMTMVQFCRDLVVAEAGRLTKDSGLVARKKAGQVAPDVRPNAKPRHKAAMP